jgi:hypothetical protein
MEQLIKVGDVSIKATSAKDRKGRKGYFIVASEISKNARVAVLPPRKQKSTLPKSSAQIRPEVKELLREMKYYKEGKIKLRTFDEFIKTV